VATLGKFTARLFKFPSIQSIAGIGDVKSLCRDGSDEESRNDAGEDYIEESARGDEYKLRARSVGH
jgi:hypothetical protein